MAQYSIRDLETLTGIKAHTIRIWEKRYGLVTPNRTETNIRHYSDLELKRLLNVSILNNHGIKISKVAKMSDEAVRERVAALVGTDGSYSTYIDNLVVAMVELGHERFERVLSDCTLRFGFEETCLQVLYPFLTKIGVMWQTDHINPAQEHFVSNLIRQKMIVAIDGAYKPTLVGAKKALLFLREGELHEIGLLFYHYLLLKNGFETIYLGQNVPYTDLIEIIKTHSPDVLVTAFVAPINVPDLNHYLEDLTTQWHGPLLVAGMQAQREGVIWPKQAFRVESATAFKEKIASI